MKDQIKKLKLHKEKLREGDPEEQKKALSLHILTIEKLQHSTTDLGLFFGGFKVACDLILSYLENEKLDLPDKNYLRDLAKKGFREYFIPYSHSCFDTYEYWKRDTEEYQIDKTNAFHLFEVAFNKMYKDFQKSKESSSKERKHDGD